MYMQILYHLLAENTFTPKASGVGVATANQPIKRFCRCGSELDAITTGERGFISLSYANLSEAQLVGVGGLA